MVQQIVPPPTLTTCNMLLKGWVGFLLGVAEVHLVLQAVETKDVHPCQVGPKGCAAGTNTRKESLVTWLTKSLRCLVPEEVWLLRRVAGALSAIRTQYFGLLRLLRDFNDTRTVALSIAGFIEPGVEELGGPLVVNGVDTQEVELNVESQCVRISTGVLVRLLPGDDPNLVAGAAVGDSNVLHRSHTVSNQLRHDSHQEHTVIFELDLGLQEGEHGCKVVVRGQLVVASVLVQFVVG